MLDKKGRFVLLKGALFNIDGRHNLNLLCSKFKSSTILGKDCFLSETGQNIMLLGDSNAVMNTEFDRSMMTKTPGFPQNVKVLNQKWNLTDAWRWKNDKQHD